MLKENQTAGILASVCIMESIFISALLDLPSPVTSIIDWLNEEGKKLNLNLKIIVQKLGLKYET